MTISTDDAERRRQAAIDLAEKMKLERDLVLSISLFFRDLRKDFRTVFVTSGAVIDTRIFIAELTSILKAHNRRVNEVFGSRLRNDVDKHHSLELELKQDTAEQIDAQLRVDADRRAFEQAPIILATSQRKIDAIFANVVSETVDQSPSRLQIAVAVNTQLEPDDEIRSRIISMTETNAMAENAKLTEVQVLIAVGAVVAGVPIAERVVKQWDAVLDERTRINHAVADGQRRRVDVPFDVGGQQLMHPTDTSLGATADNIINCRCSSQFVIGDPTTL